MKRTVALVCWLLILVANVHADDAIEVSRRDAVSRFGPALASLRNEADATLKKEPLRIVDKTGTPPSGDKRDYYDLSPYFWPNPDSADGMPYVFRDGKVNPEVDDQQYNRVGYAEMGDHARRLGLAYRLTGEEAYAEGAARVIRIWFLDEQTGMRPNFNFSQHVKGIPGGQPIGIIRGMTIVELIDITGWLESSPYWTEWDQVAWKKWLAAYAGWLQTSDLGRKEADARNNHGTWYDVQLVAIFLATDQREQAKKVLADVPIRRLTRQIGVDGAQPNELVRTRSWDYSVMNLEAMFRLARLGDAVGIDLWNWRNPDGGGLRPALDYLIPAATGEKSWGKAQIREFDAGKLYPLLKRAAVAFREPGYDQAAEKLVRFELASRRESLMALVGIP